MHPKSNYWTQNKQLKFQVEACSKDNIGSMDRNDSTNNINSIDYIALDSFFLRSFIHFWINFYCSKAMTIALLSNPHFPCSMKYLGRAAWLNGPMNGENGQPTPRIWLWRIMTSPKESSPFRPGLTSCKGQAKLRLHFPTSKFSEFTTSIS